MNKLQTKLYALSDSAYHDFHKKLIPGIPLETIMGIRVPVLRKFAREFSNTPDVSEFLNNLPHKYYDENMLHALILQNEKDFRICLFEVERFLPYIDNWAVCDSLRPKCFAKHKTEILIKATEWSKSEKVYTCRFGIEVLMNFFLDDDFKPEFLQIPVSVKSDEYYIKMMIAWYYATALAKQWKDTLPYIENGRLDTWTHNKTIQKACESFRITNEQKEYLKSLRK